MAKYQIVIDTDHYEKSPISDNYVFEGKGFAGSINPKSPNVTVKKGSKAGWTDDRKEKVWDLLISEFGATDGHADSVMKQIEKLVSR